MQYFFYIKREKYNMYKSEKIHYKIYDCRAKCRTGETQLDKWDFMEYHIIMKVQ